jgi:hypothetical protein
MTRIFYAGADIRESCAQPDNDWTQDRREGFLLRLDVIRPLSVDPNVWGLARRPADEKAGTPLLATSPSGAGSLRFCGITSLFRRRNAGIDQAC